MNQYEWIARWKGLLIFLVALGHVVGAGRYLSGGSARDVLESMYGCIYSFHMPAFFIVSGMCWHPAGFTVYLKKKAFRLLIPYIIFGLLSILIYAFIFGYAVWWQPIVSLLHAGTWPGGMGFKCNSVLWFLPCMFSVLMVYWGVEAVLPGKWSQMALLVLLVVLQCGFNISQYHLPWGLSLVPWYLSFLIAGRLFFRLSGVCAGKHLNKWLLGVALGMLVLSIPLLYLSGFPWVRIWGRNFIAAIIYSGLAAVFVQLVGGQIGRRLAILGESSMGIMLMHKFVVVACQEKMPFVRALFSDSVALTLFASVFIAVISVVLSLMATIVIRRLSPVLLGERHG